MPFESGDAEVHAQVVIMLVPYSWVVSAGERRWSEEGTMHDRATRQIDDAVRPAFGGDAAGFPWRAAYAGR